MVNKIRNSWNIWGPLTLRIVTDAMEDRLGYQITTNLVKKHLSEVVRDIVGRNAIMKTVLQLEPKVTKIGNWCQGNKKES